jgi:hypothetical protein
MVCRVAAFRRHAEKSINDKRLLALNSPNDVDEHALYDLKQPEMLATRLLPGDGADPASRRISKRYTAAIQGEKGEWLATKRTASLRSDQPLRENLKGFRWHAEHP